MIKKEQIADQFRALQLRICEGLEDMDRGAAFQEDPWTLHSGGGGKTRVILGNHIEKGGVNFSAVWGPASDKLQKMLKKQGDTFFATGVSIVLHARSPHVPIIHMNVRYFEMGEDVWWFGGGIDVTPHYINTEQAKHFHQLMKDTCDRTAHSFYPKFKTWADDYFYLKHRQETRGIGGIFFDRLSSDEQDISKEQLFDFVMDVGHAFLPAYQIFFSPNYEKPVADHEKEWQLYRRGRYAEFNLVWDRGTRFGLETGGRTESILMSLPPECIWQYNRDIPADSPEGKSQALLKKGIDWL